MPRFTKRDPIFTPAEVGKLFGISDQTVLRSWIEPGHLHASSRELGKRHLYAISPEALLAFVRECPDLYETRRITDEPLKREAERIQARDPLESLELLASTSGLPLKDVVRLARQGLFPTVQHRQGKPSGWGQPQVRRSQVPAALKALKEATAVPSALDALHALLAPPAPSVAAEEKPVVKTIGPGYVPNGATDWRGQPLPPRAPQERCARCDGKLLAGQDPESRQPVLVCMSCGHEQTPANEEAAPGESSASGARGQKHLLPGTIVPRRGAVQGSGR